MEKQSRTMKKVIWKKEYGEGLYPFCPYCGEYAYDYDKCVFCGEAYEYTEAPVPPTIVEVDGHKVIQTNNSHICIYNAEGRLVCHKSCTVKKTKDELIETYNFFKELKRDG